MLVRDMIQILEQLDPDAEVLKYVHVQGDCENVMSFEDLSKYMFIDESLPGLVIL